MSDSSRNAEFSHENWRSGVFRLQKRTLFEFLKRVSQLLLRVHHDWAIPRYRFFQWLAGNQQKADALIAGLDGYFVAAIKEHQRAIVSLRWRSGIKPAYGLCGHSQRDCFFERRGLRIKSLTTDDTDATDLTD